MTEQGWEFEHSKNDLYFITPFFQKLHTDQNFLYYLETLTLHVVVVLLLLNVRGQQLRSCWDGQLTWPHFSCADLNLLSG